LPIPLMSRGSVRARLRVWFSAERAARNAFKSVERSQTSIPPASSDARPPSPLKRYNEARRLEPASVSISDPFGKSKTARFCRPASLAGVDFQCKRPAIIKCNASQRSPSSPKTMRFPIRRSSRTTRPSTLESGGCAVRNKNALTNRMRSSGRPTTRGSSAPM